jgi:Flp pilus assembly protein TadD
MNGRFLIMSGALLSLGIFFLWFTLKTDDRMIDTTPKSVADPSNMNSTKASQVSSADGAEIQEGKTLKPSFGQSTGASTREDIPANFAKSPSVFRENKSMLKNESVSRAEIQRQLQEIRNLYDRGSDGDVIWKLNELMDSYPSVPEYAAAMIEIQIELGNWRDAELAIRHLLKIDPQNAYAKSALANVLQKLGRNDEMESFEKPE